MSKGNRIERGEGDRIYKLGMWNETAGDQDEVDFWQYQANNRSHSYSPLG